MGKTISRLTYANENVEAVQKLPLEPGLSRIRAYRSESGNSTLHCAQGHLWSLLHDNF